MRDTLTQTFHKPLQNIPESKKNENWCIDNMDWIISMCPRHYDTVEKKAYNRYNGVRNDSDYEHITETYGVEFPAGKLKHIPLVRPLLNTLQGEQEERPFSFIVRSEDNDSISRKYEQVSSLLIQEIVDLIRSGEPVDVTMDSLEKYYKEDFQSELEIASHHALKAYINKHHLEKTFHANFRDKLITGREYCRITINRIGEDPVVEDIRPGQIFYADNDVRWVSECDWAVYPKAMSPTEILDRFGDRMKATDIRKLDERLDYYDTHSYKLSSLSDADRLIESSEELSSYLNNTYTNKLTVWFGEWKSIRKINYLESPNKYDPDVPFIKYIPDNQVARIPGSRRKFLKTGYIQDLWQGVRIGDGGVEGIYVDLGRVDNPVRSLSEPSKVHLSFDGPTYNGTVKPYSFVIATEDIQDLYDIMHYHKENLIALSGTRGSVMDISQLPDFKTGSFEDNLKMWFYYKKMGALFLDRNAEGADRSFNQFGTYDDTLGAGMGVILQTIQHLEELAGRIVGVNRQRMGAISQRDGKGTTENAIMQSSLVTEAVFNEHDEFTRRILERLMNAMRIAWRDGYTGFYVSDQYLQEVFTLTPEFPLADLGVYVTNTVSDQRSIAEIKQYMYEQTRNGMAQIEDVFPLYRKSNLKDIEITIKQNLERRRAEILQKQQQVQQVQQQIEMATAQGEIQKLQAEVRKLVAEIEDMERKAALEQQALNIEQEYNQDKIALDAKRVDLEAKQIEVAGRQRGNSTEVRNK